MVATRVVATPNIADAAKAHAGLNLGVALYHHGQPVLPGVGPNIRDQVARQLPRPPTQRAWDFLSIALAAFSADRFVRRALAEDGWTRVIDLKVAVAEPTVWQQVSHRLASAFRFLTGDIWSIEFMPNGDLAPSFQARLSDRDSICLFSGGLDSFLGALNLLDSGRHPLLISQGSPKEISPQKYLARMIGLESHRFDGRVQEHWKAPYEGSTRGRSIIFFAYGVLAASGLNIREVIVPENGLIAINPPLTPRRLGSLSTRTTHPHFLTELNHVLADVGIDVRLRNIFEGKSKGQMLAESKSPLARSLSFNSYSCGKGKRQNGQCGRCIPCLIRRASFDAAGFKDQTRYFNDIARGRKYDDVMSARIATARAKQLTPAEFSRWVAASGPLPNDAHRRMEIIGAVRAGLDELGQYLEKIRWR